MDALDYPVSHFSDMLRLATALKSVPAQLLEHHYLYDVFGSWYVIVDRAGVSIRVAYDGRDSSLLMSRSTERKHPFTWIDESSIPVARADVVARALEMLERHAESEK